MNERGAIRVPHFESLTIFFPMWNEEGYIRQAVAAGKEVCEELIAEGEIGDYALLIVDDASTDGTGAIADALAAGDPRVRVIHHPENRKLGGSLRTGFESARGELVLYTDADLPFDLAEVRKACRLLRIYGADVVSAYRHDRTAEGSRRAVYSFAYNWAVRLAFGVRVRDVNFAFKLVRRRVLEDLRLRSEGSFIDAELLVRAHRLGYRIIQFGVDYFPRSRGVSTLSSGAVITKIVREMGGMWGELRRATPPSRGRAGGPRLLIVNADDYGLTEAVSRGILRAHREGIVTSTSLLAVGPAFRTAAWLEDCPDLGVGVHLAAVGEDPPLLSSGEIPTLVDRRGRLPLTWRAFLARAVPGRVDPADLAREFEAQIERVRQLGLPVTHLDTHQHLHLWPPVRDVVLGLAARHGVPAIRVPRAHDGRALGAGVNVLSRELARRAGERGLAFPADFAGLEEAGRLDAGSLERVLDRVDAGGAPSAEICAHPGEADDPDRGRYRWGYRWAEELAALACPTARRGVERRGFTPARYDALAPGR